MSAVNLGVRADGCKELPTVTAMRASRGGSVARLPNAAGCARRYWRPATGPGFWDALREVFPDTKEQRCWFHCADLGIMPMPLLNPLQGKGFLLRRSA